MSKVIDFQEKRNESIEKRKRSFERVLFTEFLGSYAEIDENGTKFSVTMVDISREGCLFQIPFASGSLNHFKNTEYVTVRVYFTKDDFLPLSVKIKHFNEYVDEKGDAYLRFGGEFDKNLPSFQAFEPFIEFIYKFAEYSCVDHGESKVYFL
ncbi:MAG: PilZ domain-containing protein [Bacteriovoracaceae bacterium]|nr:PilZ domain-containing protein [Bacteriovoracaceae bacterium]